MTWSLVIGCLPVLCLFMVGWVVRYLAQIISSDRLCFQGPECKKDRLWAFRATWRSFKWWESRENIWTLWWSLCKSVMLPGCRCFTRLTQQRKVCLHCLQEWHGDLQETTTWTSFNNAFQYCFDPRSTDTARKETFSHRKLPWTTWLPKSKLSQAGGKQQNNTMTIFAIPSKPSRVEFNR